MTALPLNAWEGERVPLSVLPHQGCMIGKFPGVPVEFIL